MGTNYYAVSTTPTINTPIYIGKSSMGWKFLFHRVSDYENWIDKKPLNTFPQWKEFLETHTEANRIVIMNEYDEQVKFEDLLWLIERKQQECNPEDFRWSDNIDGYRFTSGEFC